MTEAESKEGREGGEHWSTTPERRGMWGLRLLWLLYRIGGRPLFALIGTPVAFIFRLTGTRAREASDRFLERVAERREALGPSRGTPTSEPSPRACSTVLPHGRAT